MEIRNNIDLFREKTENCFHEIKEHSPAEIEAILLGVIKDVISAAGIDKEIQLIDLVISGSRSRGFEKEYSDLDIVLEFKSDSWREDSFFDFLHEQNIQFEGVNVDINPITEGKSGTLEEYLPRAEKYLMEKEEKENRELLWKASEADVCIGCGPMFFGNLISLPVEYDDFFSDHEQRRLREVLEKQLLKRKPELKDKISAAKKKTQCKEPKKTKNELCL